MLRGAGDLVSVAVDSRRKPVPVDAFPVAARRVVHDEPAGDHERVVACMNSGSDLGASSPGSAITAERPFPMRREPLIARPSVSTRPLDLSVFTFSAMPYLRNVVIT